MSMGKPGKVSGGIVDLSGNNFGEAIGWIVIAGRGAGDFLVQRIRPSKKSAIRLAEKLRVKFPAVEIYRVATNVEIDQSGEPVLYSPTATHENI